MKAGVAGVAGVSQLNTRSNVEVAKPQTFNGLQIRFQDFLMVCKLFIRMRIKEVAVKEQIQ